MLKIYKKRQSQIDKENGFKICHICKEKQKLEDFYYLERKDYYSPYCKICRDSKKRVGEKKRQIEIDLKQKIKKCDNCQQTKALDDFYLIYRSGKPNYFSYDCKICSKKKAKIKHRKWREKHPVIQRPTQYQIDLQNKIKTCSYCNESKSLENFYYSKPKKGFSSQCKKCIAKKEKEKKILNPRKIKFKIDEQNGTKLCHRCKEIKSLKNFRFRIIAGLYPNYCSYCKKCEKEEHKIYNIKNRDKYLALKQRHNKKVRNSIEGKINATISCAIHGSLNGYNNGTSWKKMVGYDIEELKSYTESKWKPGMTWENHGLGNNKWHFDHILPKRLFKFTSHNNIEFKICWDLKNLSPEWGLINETKRDLLDNGKLANRLTEQERLEYLKSKGFDLFYLYPSLQDTYNQDLKVNVRLPV